MRTKKLTIESYYGTTKLNPNWSVQNLIQERANRESEVFYSQPNTLPPLKPVEPLKQGVGLWNLLRNSVLIFKP